MARIVVVMGPTGAGKSVQAERLAKVSGGVHLSSGALLRQDPAEAAMLASGELVPDAEVERVVAKAIDDTPLNKNIVLDGFPRTLPEAEWLDDQLSKWGRELERVVVLEVPAAVTHERLARRGRNDDSPAAQREKLQDYEDLTRPVLEHYRDLGLLARVNGVGTIEEVARAVMEVLR